MNIRDLEMPYRVGTTSYIIEDDLVANATFLAERVQDMQLVLFDLPEGPSNLPDAPMIRALKAIGGDHDFSFTVHLMDDLRLLASDGRESPSMERGREVIELTRDLMPQAYVLHLDAKEFRVPGFSPSALARWQDEMLQALELVGQWAGDPSLLEVENLESYPPEFVTPIVERLPVSRCVDVGHLWLDGHDALPHLKSALHRTRVVHIHGVNKRDHVSLAHSESEALDAVISILLKAQFDGVVTLEIFGLPDFETSIASLLESVERCQSNLQ